MIAANEFAELEKEFRKSTPESIDLSLTQFAQTFWSWLIHQNSKVQQNAGFEYWKKLHELVFQRWDASVEGPVPVWIPTREQIEQSNIRQFSSHLSQLAGGCSEVIGNESALFKDRKNLVADLHQFISKNSDLFWSQCASEICGIDLSGAPQTKQYDRETGKCDWFAGLEFNVASCCFRTNDSATAIVFSGADGKVQSMTYGQLDRLSNRVANGLIDNGFQKGDSISVLMPMTAESVAIYLGIIKAGCVAVSIADSFASPEIESRNRIAHAKAIITYDLMNRAGKSIDLFTKIQNANSPRAIVLSANKSERPSAKLRPGDMAWNEFLSDNDVFEPSVCDRTDPINILFSSGTTGDPKAIPWNHLTPIKCATDGYLHQNIQAGDVVAWPTNLGWMMGPWLIFASLINRATIALFEDVPTIPEFGKFVEQARVTMLGVIPTIVKHWQSTGSMEPYDWNQIKVFSSTGEASHPDDMTYLSYLAGFKPIIEYCGGTEIGGGYVSSTVVEPNYPGAFTTSAIGSSFEILDEKNEPADRGQVFLVPPSVGLSERLINRDHFEVYFEGCPKNSENQTLRRHGDYFQKLPGGVFVAGGRADDTMNLGGIKISSAELERTLNRLSEIRETAAVSIPSQDRGPDELIVFVVPDGKPDMEPLHAAMNREIKTKLNPLFKISKVIIAGSLPRTASNKVMRRKLRDQLLN